MLSAFPAPNSGGFLCLYPQRVLLSQPSPPGSPKTISWSLCSSFADETHRCSFPFSRLHPKTFSLHVSGLQKGNFVFADILDNSRVVSEDGKKKVGVVFAGLFIPMAHHLGLTLADDNRGESKNESFICILSCGLFWPDKSRKSVCVLLCTWSIRAKRRRSQASGGLTLPSEIPRFAQSEVVLAVFLLCIVLLWGNSEVLRLLITVSLDSMFALCSHLRTMFQLKDLLHYYYPIEIDPNRTLEEKRPLMVEW